MKSTPQRLSEMHIENDAQLRVLYALRSVLREMIRDREALRTEFFRKGGGK